MMKSVKASLSHPCAVFLIRDVSINVQMKYHSLGKWMEVLQYVVVEKIVECLLWWVHAS